MLSRTIRRVLLEPAEGLLLQVPRALLVSVLAMLVDVALLFFLVGACGMQAIPAAVTSYLVGALLQYALCSIWVFSGAARPATGGFAAFMILSLGGLGLTAGTIQFMQFVWGSSLGIAKFVALGLAFTWNFTTRKLLVFRPGLASEPVTE